MIKFSLILPVYNIEFYLPSCLNSCINQNLPKDEYEILLVIDGATDNSKSIAFEYGKRNSNVVIIDKENGGLSDSRNVGLLKARGRYIWFIDSDDFIQENVLRSLYSEMEEYNLECLWLKWKNVDLSGNVLPYYGKVINKERYEVMCGKEFMRYVLSTYLFSWSFVYRRDFLLNNNLFFEKGMYYEDADFAYKSVPLLQRIKLYHQICYFYLKRACSITSNTDMKKFKDMCKNAQTAYLGYRANINDVGLANFYFESYSAFFLVLLKHCIKTKSVEATCYLDRVITNNGFTKVKLWGGRNSKILALLYNVLGWNYLRKIF